MSATSGIVEIWYVILALLLWACALEVLRILEPETVFSQCTTVAWRLRPNCSYRLG